MDYRHIHREDVKGAIRKRFGSLHKFELEHGLFKGAVNDLLRGRFSANVATLVNAVLIMESAVTTSKPTVIPVATANRIPNHRLIEKAA